MNDITILGISRNAKNKGATGNFLTLLKRGSHGLGIENFVTICQELRNSFGPQRQNCHV